MRGVIEGYYGPPFSHEARIDFMQWMAGEGLTVYAYAPKDDPFHRDRWREPYPDDEMQRFEELVRKGKECGVDFCYTISPGLDISDGEEGVLVDKLRTLADVGFETFGVLWDDVPAGGTELGERHGRATAAAVDAIGGATWWTVGTDYAISRPTPYLEGLCRTVPDEVLVSWTGSGVTPASVTGAEAAGLGDALGRKLLLWENFPVNDSVMRDVLHMGPYPNRSPDLVDASSGVLLNLMQHPYASRIGVACGARFWRDPKADRQRVWRDVIGGFGDLAPLARACRSWADDPGPDPDLLEWAAAAPQDKRLRSFLEAGCRGGLSAEVQADLEPWLAAWEREAQLMLMCLDILERGYRSTNRGVGAAVLWFNARTQRTQTFGLRAAAYPVTLQSGEFATTGAEAAIIGENLTDRLCRRALHAPL
ncbi:MAG: beta-N-acetylglucosaminidase domain-containing protein [Actinomycetota bacterium]